MGGFIYDDRKDLKQCERRGRKKAGRPQGLRKELNHYVFARQNQHCTAGLSSMWVSNRNNPYFGYLTKRDLYTWIMNEATPKPSQKELNHINTAEHFRNPSLEAKIDALHRCFMLGKSIKSVSEEETINVLKKTAASTRQP